MRTVAVLEELPLGSLGVGKGRGFGDDGLVLGILPFLSLFYLLSC